MRGVGDVMWGQAAGGQRVERTDQRDRDDLQPKLMMLFRDAMNIARRESSESPARK